MQEIRNQRAPPRIGDFEQARQRPEQGVCASRKRLQVEASAVKQVTLLCRWESPSEGQRELLPEHERPLRPGEAPPGGGLTSRHPQTPPPAPKHVRFPLPVRPHRPCEREKRCRGPKVGGMARRSHGHTRRRPGPLPEGRLGVGGSAPTPSSLRATRANRVPGTEDDTRGPWVTPPVTRVPPSGPMLRTHVVLGRPQATGEQYRCPGPGQKGQLRSRFHRGLDESHRHLSFGSWGFTSELHSRGSLSLPSVWGMGCRNTPVTPEFGSCSLCCSDATGQPRAHGLVTRLRVVGEKQNCSRLKTIIVGPCKACLWSLLHLTFYLVNSVVACGLFGALFSLKVLFLLPISRKKKINLCHQKFLILLWGKSFYKDTSSVMFESRLRSAKRVL